MLLCQLHWHLIKTKLIHCSKPTNDLLKHTKIIVVTFIWLIQKGHQAKVLPKSEYLGQVLSVFHSNYGPYLHRFGVDGDCDVIKVIWGQRCLLTKPDLEHFVNRHPHAADNRLGAMDDQNLLWTSSDLFKVIKVKGHAGFWMLGGQVPIIVPQ